MEEIDWNAVADRMFHRFSRQSPPEHDQEEDEQWE